MTRLQIFKSISCDRKVCTDIIILQINVMDCSTRNNRLKVFPIFFDYGKRYYKIRLIELFYYVCMHI